jgi:transposase InsO family protein
MLSLGIKQIAGYLIPQIVLMSEYDRWRKVADIFKLTKAARLRLEWIIYYQDHSASETATHFGISRKTFYKRYGLFDRDNIYSLYKLEDKSRAPVHVRQKEITPEQQLRIVLLRKQYIRYGKMKLEKIYERTYRERISSWKIQKVIEAKKLYYNPARTAKITRKRQTAQKKKRITELRIPFYKRKPGYIICIDAIVIHWNSIKRYIFTAIDKFGKVAFARTYKSKSSYNATDFLLRLKYLLNDKMINIQTDNGSEFNGSFKQACEKLGIQQYFNRVQTPKDNATNERFNRILQEEFLELGNFTPDIGLLNKNLTEWLVEYNFYRPHQALGYQTPIEVSKVLPMWSSCTHY